MESLASRTGFVASRQRFIVSRKWIPGARNRFPGLAPAERRVHRRRAIEVDPLDVGPGHVLGAPTAGDEDQQAAISLREVAVAFEPQLLAVVEPHSAGRRDRGDQAEGDRVVQALRWSVEGLGGLALVEIEDHPAGEPTSCMSGDAPRERAPRREVTVGRAAAAGAQIEALEVVPRDLDPAVAPVVDVDPANAAAGFAGS